MRGDDLRERIAAIGSLLRAWQPLWREHAFRTPVLPWESEHAPLACALRALTLEECERLHEVPALASEWLARWLPVPELHALEDIAQSAPRPLPPWPPGFTRDVPGRKWAQVEAFVRALAALPAHVELVDWCAGKGHLARALGCAHPGPGIVALERDAALVMDSVRLARRDGIRMRAVRCDVLEPAAEPHVHGAAHVVALHACGHLHLRLFELAVARRPLAVSCAPCCYHLAGVAGARPRSQAGIASWPGIGADDLRTAVQETVTADGHARRRRRHLQQWQLGFDLLARELRGVDEYLPIPPVDGETLRGGFAAFCAVVARHKGLALPPQCDFARYERAGQRRYVEVCALDLVRHRFRRLLELWLVLDRALLLAESGYDVSLARFCDRSVSPRDLLLQAYLA